MPVSGMRCPLLDILFDQISEVLGCHIGSLELSYLSPMRSREVGKANFVTGKLIKKTTNPWINYELCIL